MTEEQDPKGTEPKSTTGEQQSPPDQTGTPPEGEGGGEGGEGGDVKSRVANAAKKARSSHGGAVSTVAKEKEDDLGYELISEEGNELGPSRDGQFLYLTVVADTAEQVVSPAAKAFVYDKRFEFGMPNAGIEQFEGPFPLDKKGKMIRDTRKAKPVRYAYRFRLRPGISGV